MKYENEVVQVSNYATDSLQDTLTKYGQAGFRLVNVVMAQNRYSVEVMYLFFTRELGDETEQDRIMRAFL